MQNGQLEKLRMLQAVKWDIVRAKEKEMQNKLDELKSQQKKMEKCITHIVLHQIVAKLFENIQAFKLKK